MTTSKNLFVRSQRAIAGILGIRTLIVILATSVVALGCGWSLLTDRSVRFNTYRSGRDFYRLPPLPIMYDAKSGKELTVMAVENYDYGWENEIDYRNTETAPPESESDKIWREMQTAVGNEDFGAARVLLEKILSVTETPELHKERDYPRRNAAYDMLDAMTALKQGSSGAAVRTYLEARQSFGLETAAPETEELITRASSDKNLQDNAEYLRAAVLVRQRLNEDALSALEHHSVKYPKSEKNDSVLYMIAKLKMESSYAFTHTGCGIEGNTYSGEEIERSKAEPTEKCRDESWRAAVKGFEELKKDFPNGRYHNDASGWLGYLHRRGGERARSLAEYYRLLGHPTDRAARLGAKQSLQMIGHEYSDETLDEVERLIADDVDASMAYAYHRIYNHAVDFSGQKVNRWCCRGDTQWQEREEESKRVATLHSKGNHELDRIAGFATAMMRRYPQARVSGGFVLRVAEAQMELQSYADALKSAKKALSLDLRGDLREQALWVKGSSEHQLKHLTAARSTFEQVVSEFPDNKLTEGARRLLAMIAENQGDLESALDHYLTLKYDYDVAFFVDVLLPIDRLAKFVAARKTSPHYDKLLYSLGVRYFRDRRWAEARATFRSVLTKPDEGDDWYPTESEPRQQFAKVPKYDPENRGEIKASWVMRDLKTIDTLENLEEAVDAVHGDEAKAEAMYQLASYQFDSSSLLFYNPGAWDGSRYGLLSDLADSDRMRSPNESQIIFDHFQSHDTLARAIPIYIDIVNRFPETRAARDAAYSAAVAHERLSDLNPFWRATYGKDLFASPRKLTYADVRSLYPQYQLPKATYGWEPSTRTVNGGPGWAPAPKPAPRETREQKIKRMLRETADTVTTKFLSKVEEKIGAGVAWYDSRVEAAVYGVLAGVGLWIVFLVGVGLHSQRLKTQLLPDPEEPSNADSRVDKMIG